MGRIRNILQTGLSLFLLYNITWQISYYKENESIKCYNVKTGIIELNKFPKIKKSLLEKVIPFSYESESPKELIKFPEIGYLLLNDDVSLPHLQQDNLGKCFQQGGIYSEKDIYDLRNGDGESISMPDGLIKRLSESNFFCETKERLSNLESEKTKIINQANEDYVNKASQF
jgi:hypothetical protein